MGRHNPPGLFLAAAHAISQLPKGLLSELTAYVTLEPCFFVGRTPSCAKSLVELGIKQVVIGMLAPDPRNNGRGIRMLQAADIDVSEGILNEKISEFITPYLNLTENKY